MVFAAEMRGKKPAKSSAPIVADLAKEAAVSIVEPLRRRLEQVISSDSAEDQAVLVEALGSAYREWKSQRIERIAGDTLSAAFSRGTWDEVPAGTPLALGGRGRRRALPGLRRRRPGRQPAQG